MSYFKISFEHLALTQIDLQLSVMINQKNIYTNL